MQYERKKVTLIANKLMSFLLYHGANDVEVKIKIQESDTMILLSSKECQIDQKSVDFIAKNLQAQRQVEVESYYWQLLSDSGDDDGLHIVASMIDESEVTYKDQELKIEIVRRRI